MSPLGFRCVCLGSLLRFFGFRMHGLSLGCSACICKACLRQTLFWIKHLLGVCVLCLGLACHQASSFGFALSHLAWARITWISMHSFELTITCLLRMLTYHLVLGLYLKRLSSAGFLFEEHMFWVSVSFVWVWPVIMHLHLDSLCLTCSDLVSIAFRCPHLDSLSCFFVGCLAYHLAFGLHERIDEWIA